MGGFNLYSYTINPTGWVDPLGWCGEAKMQPYRNDVMTKGPHADIFVGGRKVSEAVLDSNGKWVRWGDLATDKKLLRQADKIISNMSNNTVIMNEARSQLKQVIGDAQKILSQSSTKAPIYQQAERAITRFTKLLKAIT